MGARATLRGVGGLLPVLLLLTATTGIVDAVSYLGMGHVLVANMTGNVVFLGFAFVGAAGFSVAALAVALAAFLAGALLGGRLAAELATNRRRWLVTAGAAQTGLAGVAAIAVATGALNPTGNARLGVIALLGVGMGIQNATVRRLAVPDLTTTVLTMTLTGLAADSLLAGGSNPRSSRRIASIVAMLSGGVTGGALMLHTSAAVSLGVFAGALTAATAAFLSTGSQRPDGMARQPTPTA